MQVNRRIRTVKGYCNALVQSRIWHIPEVAHPDTLGGQGADVLVRTPVVGIQIVAEIHHSFARRLNT